MSSEVMHASDTLVFGWNTNLFQRHLSTLEKNLQGAKKVSFAACHSGKL